MGVFKKSSDKFIPPNVWARPEMSVTFRAGIMPGKNRRERTFTVKEVLRNNRVTLHEFEGEHRESSFEPIDFKRENP